ncbi:unnamed protein product [Closterium sp. NIES-54]
MAAAKRVLRYLCSTSGMGLVLGGRRPVVLTGHADASWADDQATQRLSQGYTFSLGSGSVSWRSTRSSSVLSSSCEAEIYAGAMAAQELRWLTYLLTDLGEQPRSPPVLYVDNKAMLALCREHRLEHRTKHIALRYFLARELQQRGQLRLAYVASEANTADIFTKVLAPGDHQRFCTLLDNYNILTPITSYVGTIKFMDELEVPNLPLDSKGNYFSEYGFGELLDAAAKYMRQEQLKQIEASPFISIQLDESTDKARSKHMIVYVHFMKEGASVCEFLTLLTVDKCDAASLVDVLLTHLNAVGIDLSKIVGISTDGARVMTGTSNGVVARLRQRNPCLVSCHCIAHCNYSSHAHSQVDITVVAGEVSLTCRTIDVRYVLCAFLKKHGNPEHREVTVKGVDQNGEAAEHEFVLHKRKIPGHKTGGDYYSCKAVCQEFARVCVARLEFRLEDLKNLAGSKLFRPSCYPDDNAQRMKKCREWLGMLDHMFHHRLFGTPPGCACNVLCVLQGVREGATVVSPHHGYQPREHELPQVALAHAPVN